MVIAKESNETNREIKRQQSRVSRVESTICCITSGSSYIDRIRFVRFVDQKLNGNRRHYPTTDRTTPQHTTAHHTISYHVHIRSHSIISEVNELLLLVWR